MHPSVLNRATEAEVHCWTAKQVLPQFPLRAEHVRRCAVLPDREAILDALPKGLVVAEVGVAYGDFTKQILKRCRPSVLYLVDSWATERYEEGLEAIRSEFEDAIVRGEIIVRSGLSTAVLPTLPDDTLDFVYIDTDHSYETTAAELRQSAAKMRKGGRIAGHDYCVGNIAKPWAYGVIEAVGEFCNKYDWGFEYISLDFDGHSTFSLRRLRELDAGSQ
jgi:hypothetical protein